MARKIRGRHFAKVHDVVVIDDWVDNPSARILALDPGPEKTGWVDFYDRRVLECSTLPNGEILKRLDYYYRAGSDLAIEMVASYGMAVGKEVFETVRWIGRFQQAWGSPENVLLVYRQDVKLHLCNSARAKDANIRQALIDLLGAPGTKKNPGPTYGVSGHVWSALAVAVTAEALYQVAHLPRRKQERAL